MRRDYLDDPHLALAVAVVLVLGCEALRGSATLLTSPVWPVLQALIALSGLAVAWRRQERLRLVPVVVIGISFQLAWVVLHLLLGVHSDGDSSVVYPQYGDALLSGTYPHATYPAGAVLLFALEAWLAGGGHAVRIANAFMMVPFQLVTVVTLWRLRPRWSAWIATVVAIWPLNAFFWEFKFDLAPTAALVVGLALATRRRWALAGLALGVGASLKWTPALAGIVLAAWLLAQGRPRSAARHFGAMAGAFVAINLPFLLTSPNALWAAYRLQSGRGIEAESMFYVPPVIPFEKSVAIISHAVGAAAWANDAAIALQAVLLIALLVAALRVASLRSAVAIAAMAPVIFLLSNRIFSPQYLVTMVGAWALAGSLLAGTRHDQLRLCLLIFAATLANVLVYPTGVRTWPIFTVLLFVFGFAATGWVAGGQHRRARRQPSHDTAMVNPSVG